MDRYKFWKLSAKGADTANRVLFALFKGSFEFVSSPIDVT